jgi:hypothetical protein
MEQKRKRSPSPPIDRGSGAELRRHRPVSSPQNGEATGRRRAPSGDKKPTQGRYQNRRQGEASGRRSRPASQTPPARENGEQKPVHFTLSERSIKAAQRRKAIRAENDRLHRLREKQKRQAKRRTVKHISKGLFKRLIIMAGVIVAVILSMIIFFRVENIVVEGNSYYSREEVLSACGVDPGDNLLTLSRGEISGNIMAPLSYVDRVKVSRQLPNTLILHITEGKPRYAISDTNGDYYLVTAQGKVMEQLGVGRLKDFTMVEGFRIQSPNVGEEIQIACAPSEETKARGQQDAMEALLSAIEAAELGRWIPMVQISSSYKLSLWYEDRFSVELGNSERLDYKLEYLKAVVEQEEAYVTGTIDLSLKDGDKAILRRGE